MTIKIQYSVVDGIQTWAAKGQVDRQQFLDALSSDDLFRDFTGEPDHGAPVLDDITQELIVWDEDEPENMFYLPRMQRDLDEHVQSLKMDYGEEVHLTEPAWWTMVSHDGAWPHQLQTARQNG